MPKPQHKVRVIGGTHRGRRIAVPRSGVRPTTDRVKESLFSILASSVGFEGIRVADLFAGSGALGIEALSRGAAHCVFVEQQEDAFEVLVNNVETLGLSDRSTVVAEPVERFLSEGSRAGQGFDVVFADPPYTYTDFRVLAESVGRIAPRGTLVVEHDGSIGLGDIAALTETRTYGRTALSFFRFETG